MFLSKFHNSVTYKIFKYVVGRQRLPFFIAMALSFLGGFVELVGVVTVFPFLALLANPDFIYEQPLLNRLYLAGGYTDVVTFVKHIGIVSFFSFIFMNVFMFFKNAYIFYISFSKTEKISVRLLANYLFRPFIFFLDHSSGEISKNILSQSDTVANSVLRSWLTAVSEIFVLVVIISFILSYDFTTGLTVLAGLGSICAAIYYVLRKQIYHLGQENDVANGKRYDYCMSALSAVKEIKVAQKETFFAEAFRPHVRKMASAFIKVNNIQLLPTYVLQTIVACFIIGLSLYYINAGYDMRSIVPTISLYAIAGYRLMPAFSRFSGAISQIQQHRSVFENVVTVLSDDTSNDVISYDSDQKILEVNDQVTLSNVEFTYPGNQTPTLSRFDLCMENCSITALVGPSGSGKTTVINILLGLMPVDKGGISIDRQVLSKQLLPKWLDIIGYIPQSVYIMNSTIAGNIAFGESESAYNWKRIGHVVKMAHLSEFVSELPKGLNTEVGERGSKLSAGQIQRIGIARALYRDPQVIIMDESTSALDGVTEKHIVETMQSLKKDKMIIAIAHRHSTVRACDRIHLLNDGKIIDSGSYESLRGGNPLFRKLMGQ